MLLLTFVNKMGQGSTQRFGPYPVGRQHHAPSPLPHSTAALAAAFARLLLPCLVFLRVLLSGLFLFAPFGLVSLGPSFSGSSSVDVFFFYVVFLGLFISSP